MPSSASRRRSRRRGECEGTAYHRRAVAHYILQRVSHFCNAVFYELDASDRLGRISIVVRVPKNQLELLGSRAANTQPMSRNISIERKQSAGSAIRFRAVKRVKLRGTKMNGTCQMNGVRNTYVFKNILLL